MTDYVRCAAVRPGTDAIRRLECELAAGHSVDHREGLTRWKDDMAVYPEKGPTLSAEAVREQLAGVTAGSKVPRCPYWYEGPGLSRNVRCDAMAGHHGDHQADIGDDLTFRWTSDTAKWRDPQTAGSCGCPPGGHTPTGTCLPKVTVEDVLDKLRRHGKVTPNPPLRVMDLELKPSGHDHAFDEECTAACTQVGGDHYRQRSIQPWDIWQEYGMNAFEGAVLKYLLRWRDKNGVEDLKKARHTLDKLIELEEAKGDPEAG